MSPSTTPRGAALAPPQRRQRTLEAVKRLLLRESRVQPLLLLFEDLHWTDSESQALLDGLIESLPTARILLVVSYRPEYQHAWGSKTYYTQLRIDPFPPDGAEELLTALLGQDESRSEEHTSRAHGRSRHRGAQRPRLGMSQSAAGARLGLGRPAR